MTGLEDLASALETSPAKHMFARRLLLLSEPIHSQSAKRCIEQLLAFEASDPKKPITLFLNSPGGEVTSGFAIYDTLRFIEPEVKIVVTGLAASIATVILLGAKKQNRMSLPNSRLLIHQPLISGNIQGQASDIEITAREIVKTREKIARLYHSETGQAMDRVERDIERDYWMNAQESKEYGLINRIVANWKEMEAG